MKRILFLLGLIALALLLMLLQRGAHPAIGHVVVLALLIGNMAILLGIVGKHR